MRKERDIWLKEVPLSPIAPYPRSLLLSRACDRGRPLACVPASPGGGAVTHRTLCLGVLLLLVLAVATFAGTASATPEIDAKRAEAQYVLNQIREIDAELDLAIDRYNGIELKLGAIRAERGVSKRHLKITRANLKKLENAIEDRLVTLYTEGESSYIEFLLGATSLTDFLDRVDTVDRVSDEDVRILTEIKLFRAEEKRRAQKLKRAEAKQGNLLRRQKRVKDQIESKLVERQALYSSIEDQIVELEAAEARRQEQLRRLAAARLEREQEEAAAAAAAAQTAQSSAGSTSSPGTATPVSQPAESSAPPPPPSQYGGVVGIAMQYLGTPYRWGGASPATGFDCSGFTMFVYAQVGVALPHYTVSQFQMGSAVSRSELQAGDLVFFRGLSHNGIYIGGGQFIHSPRTGDVVKISSLSDPWYDVGFVGARRL